APVGPVRTCLLSAMRNEALNLVRRIQRERALEEELLRESVLAEHDAVTTSPDDVIAARELVEIVGRIVDELPPRCQDVFLLRWREGLKHREIAARLGIELKTVEMHMTRALRMIRERLPDVGLAGRCAPGSSGLGQPRSPFPFRRTPNAGLLRQRRRPASLRMGGRRRGSRSRCMDQVAGRAGPARGAWADTGCLGRSIVSTDRDPQRRAMLDHRSWERIARHALGECSAEEAVELRAWIEADTERRVLAQELMRIVDAAPAQQWDAEAAWCRFRATLEQETSSDVVALPSSKVRPIRAAAVHARRRTGRRWLAAAAIATLVAGSSLFVWRQVLPEPTAGAVAVEDLRTVKTRPGETAEIYLSDGTRVVLAAASRLRFPERFRGPRDVHLEGEA